MGAIPKIIHYCWFGRNPLPAKAKKCIDSWKVYLPDYEIKEWNEDNFDVNQISYTSQAYQAKKYAFVSDYARFWILYKYGGLYFDTDVEVIKPFDDVVSEGAFIGIENEGIVECAPGLGLGCSPGLLFYKEMLELYETLNFINADGTYNLTTIVKYTTDQLKKYGLSDEPGIQKEIAGMTVYPKDYFNPIDYKTGKLLITENTHSIHHYMASWQSPRQKLKQKIIRILGDKLTKAFVKIKNFHK